MSGRFKGWSQDRAGNWWCAASGRSAEEVRRTMDQRGEGFKVILAAGDHPLNRVGIVGADDDEIEERAGELLDAIEQMRRDLAECF